jgi:hypothetical protein
MGAIYRPKYKGKDGVVRESAVWWVRFRQHGKTVRQSTETADERKARAFLREKEGKVALNIPVSPGEPERRPAHPQGGRGDDPRGLRRERTQVG